MDAPLNPPLRIQPLSSKPLSPQDVQVRLENFMEEFRMRGMMSHSGESATAAQLEKLVDALREEPKP